MHRPQEILEALRRRRTLAVYVLLVLTAMAQPLVFAAWYGPGYAKLSETSYRMSVSGNCDQGTHLRWLVDAKKSWERGHLGTLSVVDEEQPINAYPQFQYYGAGFYAVWGLVQVLLGDLFRTCFAIVLTSAALMVLGTYLWVIDLTRSPWTALVVTWLGVMAPYHMGDLFGPHNYPCYFAVSALPLLSYLYFRYLTKPEADVASGRARDWLELSALVLFASLVYTTHNITALLGTTLMALPFAVTVRRDLRGRALPFRRALVPAALVALSVAYYWVPIIRDRDRMMIADTFTLAFVQKSLALSTPRTIFALAPNPDPNLYTLGWAPLAAAVAFLSFRHLYVTVMLALLLVAITTGVWHLAPQVFYSVQFPGRLLNYFPLLLVFQSRKLPSWTNALIGGTCLFTAALKLLYLAPTSPVQTFELDRFPAQYQALFYQREVFNAPLPPAPAAASVQSVRSLGAIVVEPQSSMDVPQESFVFTDRSRATTVRLRWESPVQGPVFGELVARYPGGRTRTLSRVNLGATDGRSALLSACVSGASSLRVILENGSTQRLELGSTNVELFADDRHGYTTLGGSLQPVLCHSGWTPSGDLELALDPADTGGDVLLPVFYSVDNAVRIGDADLHASGGYTQQDNPQRVDERVPVNDSFLFDRPGPTRSR